MKKGFFCILLLVGLSGCQGPSVATNQSQPGPAVGRAVGTVVGAVTGQVTGGAVAAVEATGQAIGSAFVAPDKRIIRKWETVQTADGRTIQVPKDYYVDENGVIVGEVK